MLVLFTVGLMAQTNNSTTSKRICATDDIHQQKMNTDPEYAKSYNELESLVSKFVAQNPNGSSSKAVVTIPVVFHVVLTAAQFTTFLDSRITEQMTVLNRDYAGLNTHSMGAFSTTLKSNTELQFCLAAVTPTGGVSNGIEKKILATSQAWGTSSTIKHTSQGGLDAWDVNRYLNIWVCNLGSGLCGYALYPTSPLSTELGLVCHYQYVGVTGASAPYNLGGTTTHEIGHCFNLKHIWADAAGCSPDDLIADTPPQDQENYGTPSSPLYDACSTTSPGVMFMNFMDYVDDVAYANFTPGQKTRIQACFAAGGPLYNLSLSTACTSPTSSPVALFTGSPTTVSAGGQVTYTSQSTGTVATYSWSFPGGTPSTSTSAGPVTVTYNTIGVYNAILTVGTPTNTLTKTSYITVTAPGTTICGDWNTVQNTGFATQYRGISSISIVDANTVWAPAYDGSGGGATIQEFTKTINGGTTWTPGTISGNTGYGISNISAVSGTNAWAGLYNTTSGLGKVMVTTNGGTTWTQQTSASFSTAGSSWLNFIHFFDASNGVAAGDPAGGYFEIYKTSNGGTTWTRVVTGNIPTPIAAGEYGWSGVYCAFGNNIWFGTDNGRVYKSADKGATWTVATTGLADVNEIKFIDANNGIAITKVYNATSGDLTTFSLSRTTNGGTTWTAFTPTGAINTSEIAPVPGTTSTWYSVGGVWPFVASTYGSSYSTDNGLTWTTIDALQYTAVTMLNSTTGWAGGFNTSATAEGIFKWTPCTTIIDENTSISANILIYPNPAGNEINIVLPYANGEKVDISIMDIYGKLCAKTVIYSNEENPSKIDLSRFSNGIYVIEGQSSNGKFVKKISVVK